MYIIAMTHKPLKAGDIRQKGDEVQHKFGCPNATFNDEKYEKKEQWLPVRLLGHKIMESDLIVSTFRRPINE
jgi:hypothetical protein